MFADFQIATKWKLKKKIELNELNHANVTNDMHDNWIAMWSYCVMCIALSLFGGRLANFDFKIWFIFFNFDIGTADLIDKTERWIENNNKKKTQTKMYVYVK